jgi:hypothetical protein
MLCAGELMPRGRSQDDTNVLEMALVGYELEKKKIDDKIAEIRAKLGRGGAARPGQKKTASAGGGRRNLSPEARARIAAAQKKRWAEHRKRAASQQRRGRKTAKTSRTAKAAGAESAA